MSEKETKKGRYSTKTTVKLMITVFLFLVGVGFISYGIIDYLSADAGYQDIEYGFVENSEGESIYPLQEVTLTYYFAEGGFSTNAEMTKIVEKTQDDFNYVHILFDSKNLFVNESSEVIHNLAYINENPNTSIEVDELLYDSLKSAYEYTISSNGVYNVYGGEILTFWDSVATNSAITDPAINPVYANRLNAIVSEVNAFSADSSQGLVFNDANKSIEYRVTTPSDNITLDLQILKSAYAMEYLRTAINAEGYASGLLSSEYGFVLSLGANPQLENGLWSYNIYEPYYSSLEEYPLLATFLGDNSLSAVCFNTYFNNFYFIQDDDEVIIGRNFYYDARNGYNKNPLETTVFSTGYLSASASLAEMGVNALLNITCETLEDTNNQIASYGSETILGYAVYGNYKDADFILSCEYADRFYITSTNTTSHVIA